MSLAVWFRSCKPTMLRFSHSGFEGEWSLVELTKLLVQMLYLFSLLVRDVQPSKCYEKLSQLVNFVPARYAAGVNHLVFIAILSKQMKGYVNITYSLIPALL